MAAHANRSADQALRNFSLLPDEAGVRPRIAKALLACSDATIWRMIKAGTLTSVKITPRVTVVTAGSIRGALKAGG